MPFFKKPSRSLTRLLLAGILAGGVPCALRAQENAPPKKELTEKVQTAAAEAQKALDAQNWDQAIAIIDPILATVTPNTFDQAYLTQQKVMALLNKGQYSAAIEPTEAVLRLSETYKFFDERANLQLIQTLGQLYAQEAAADKSPQGQRAKYTKALEYMRRWVAGTPKPTSEIQYFVAQVLYQLANSNPDKVDMEMMKQCQAECEKGLLLTIKPREQFLLLMTAALQQQGEISKSAEYTEWLVKDYPNNKQYWQQLLNSYLVQENFVRAVNTIHRAQKLGLLNTPQDNFYLVGIYTNTQQYEQAADLLETGLRDGRLESDQKNWELLAQAYLQMRKDDKAIETLKHASKLFPKAGGIDLQIGDAYYRMDKYEEALSYLKSAVSKGVEKPGPAYVFIAYLALELKKYEDAKAAAIKAKELDPNSKEAGRLLDAVNEAIQERDAALQPKATAPTKA
jgi:tetratricopeptide (TPR) repeat protein